MQASDCFDILLVTADAFARASSALRIRHLIDELERAMTYVEELK